MAITEGSKYVVIPIQKNWSKFKIKHEDKDIIIYGADGETMVQTYGDFGPYKPEFEEPKIDKIKVGVHKNGKYNNATKNRLRNKKARKQRKQNK